MPQVSVLESKRKTLKLVGISRFFMVRVAGLTPGPERLDCSAICFHATELLMIHRIIRPRLRPLGTVVMQCLAQNGPPDRSALARPNPAIDKLRSSADGAAVGPLPELPANASQRRRLSGCNSRLGFKSRQIQ